MSITVLTDVILPESVIAAGVRGKNMRNNTRAMSGSGDATIVINWQRTLRQFELGIVPMPVSAWSQIEALHEITAGGALGFLMKDPKGSSVGSGAGVLSPLTAAGASVGTVGLGYGVPTYQLMQRLSVVGSVSTADRRITRPSSSAILRAGAAVSPTVNTSTGVVTFTADASEAITSITAGASTVLNFASGAGVVAALAVGQRVYLSGVSGTAAATLNGLSHAITSKGASSLTISTATTGLAGTGGTAAKYPQATETLTWTGGFYIPVHFLNDDIDWEILASGAAESRIIAGPSVVLQEVRE